MLHGVGSGVVDCAGSQGSSDNTFCQLCSTVLLWILERGVNPPSISYVYLQSSLNCHPLCYSEDSATGVRFASQYGLSASYTDAQRTGPLYHSFLV
jgi:hypothetical protein